MKIIQGNKETELTGKATAEILSGYKYIHIDLGTGDGQYVFKNALKNKETLYIGVEPGLKQLGEYSKKSIKQKISNVLFVVGSLEIFPNELIGTADELTIILPWGSLLQSIVNPTEESLNTIKNILKKNGHLIIYFGYAPELEPSETKRLNLDLLDKNYIENNILPVFQGVGFSKISYDCITKDEMSTLASSWAKRIQTNNKRQIYKLDLLAL
jgi:16S rRNA (adenine(1408)-N(1))-methyltransferase